MANNWSKEELVAFDKTVQGFEDGQVLSNTISSFGTEPISMERANDTIWVPQPYIARSFGGVDQSSNFGNYTQLSVPVESGDNTSVPMSFTGRDLIDPRRMEQLRKAAYQKLSSDVNVACLNVASNEGTLVVKRTVAATGFDDVAECDALMTEQGVPDYDRYLAFAPRDYNSAASDLSKSYIQSKNGSAYEKAKVGQINSFDILKLGYANTLAAAAGGEKTIDTRNAATTNFHVPKARDATNKYNVDNRYHTVTVSATSSVAAGDTFTIAGVYAVNHITKVSTGQLKTFRVISVDSDTTMTISPPIISAVGASDAEKSYQNVTVTTKSATAAITWLNTVAAKVNPFWQKDSLMIVPSKVGIPEVSDLNVVRATINNGIEIVMARQGSINDLSAKYRFDIRFNVVNLNPEMNGIMLFSQT